MVVGGELGIAREGVTWGELMRQHAHELILSSQNPPWALKLLSS